MGWIVVPSTTGGWDVFMTGTNEAIAHAEDPESAVSAAAVCSGSEGHAVVMGANGRPQRELRVDANSVLTDGSTTQPSSAVHVADSDESHPVLEAVEHVLTP